MDRKESQLLSPEECRLLAEGVRFWERFSTSSDRRYESRSSKTGLFYFSRSRCRGDIEGVTVDIMRDCYSIKPLLRVTKYNETSHPNHLGTNLFIDGLLVSVDNTSLAQYAWDDDAPEWFFPLFKKANDQFDLKRVRFNKVSEEMAWTSARAVIDNLRGKWGVG